MKCLLAIAVLMLSGCIGQKPVVPAAPDAKSIASQSLRDLEIDHRFVLYRPTIRQEGWDVYLSGQFEWPEHRHALAERLERSGLKVKSVVSGIRIATNGMPSTAIYASISVERAFVRRDVIDEPGDRDNLTEVRRGDAVFVLVNDSNPVGGFLSSLERPSLEQHATTQSSALLVHTSQGYLGYIDAEAVGEAKPTNPTVPDDPRIDALLVTARAFIGTPYVWGGTTAAGIDCSGFVMRCYESVGVNLPRDADVQARMGRLVSIRGCEQPLKPGDLMFFINKSGKVNHVAISLDGDNYIDASGKQVAVRSLAGDEKRRERFVFARRILSPPG